MSNDTRSRPMTAETIHTCSYSCERPECIKRQRDELRDRMESVLASAPPSAPEPEVHSYDPTEQRQSVTIRWPDGKCLGYVLDRTRYTDNLPPSAPVGVDDELRVQAALLRTPEFMAQFDPEKFARQLERIAAALASAPPSAPVGVEEMQRRLDREESDHGRTIDQRDAAEEALGRMFQAVTGRVAEWSSAWGYTDAIEEVEEHVAALAQKPAAVDEAMVDRAGQALYGTDWGSFEGWEADQLRRKVRAVLIAAIQQGGRTDG